MNTQQMHLDIPEDVELLLEERHILREDVQDTVEHAESTGEKFVDPASGRSLAWARPDRVTYWVEYTREGDSYRIHTAYSHRMEMKRKGTP